MTQLPSRDAILQWISDHPTLTTKRDIAKAFGIKGAARIDLKQLLKQLEGSGDLRPRVRSTRDSTTLPPVSVLELLPPDADGDLFATPLEWDRDTAPPQIQFIPKSTDPAMGAGDRFLARLAETPDGYQARLIRRIGANPQRIVGIFRAGAEGGRILPIDKGEAHQWVVSAGATGDAKDGELVEAEHVGPKGRLGLPKARIIARLGDPTAPRAVSLIAIHQHGIPDHFPDAVIAAADAATPAAMGQREDLRALPLVTIDPSDARDHDDACYAQPDGHGGHTLWVAIADVAHYVRPQGPLDREARKRGNSTYFPDRVVPMLPDTLSGDLCSLHQGVPRPVIVAKISIDATGHKTGHSFSRAMMQSHASLTYEQVQTGIDGAADAQTAPLIDSIIRPLYAAYAALMLARAERQPLDLDLPERRIALDDAGHVTSVAFKDRLDAHRLIEEFMVLANVCAAETLIAKKTPLLFRVHEEPNPQKLDALREVAQSTGLVLAKGQVLKTAHLNRLLEQAKGTDHAELINIATLRSMTQAYYGPENFGHFGLALRNYAHFTSPIRRYSDLIVHRALIAAHRWGADGLSPADIEQLTETGEVISDTERRSMLAERDTTDRYLAAFLSDRIGAQFAGRISGIARFGVFVKLDETGADGLIPIRSLGNEFFHHDADSQTLMGATTGLLIGLGQRVVVKLAEAVPVSGGLILELIELDERVMPKAPARRFGKSAPRNPGPRKPGPARDKAAKVARKVKRTRG